MALTTDYKAALASQVLRAELRNQSRPLPNFAFQSAAFDLASLVDSFFVVRRLDPLSKADVPRAIETIQAILSHGSPTRFLCT